MRKFIFVFFIWLLLILNLQSYSMAMENNMPDNLAFIVVNDQLVSFKGIYPEILNGITYVPARFFVESIGAQIKWDTFKKSAYIQMQDREVILDLSTKTLFTDEGHIMTDCVYIKDNKIMAPYKFMANYFGYQVSYIKNGPIIRAADGSAHLKDEELPNQICGELSKERKRIMQEIKRKIEKENERRNKEIESNSKIAYITFDDGPTIYTMEILNILEKYGARATFFMLSDNIKKYRETVNIAAAQGNSIGLHGVSHDAKRIFSSSKILLQEMQECNNSLQEVAGFRTDLIRVPYGSKPYMTEDFKDILEQYGFIIWDWNVDSQDSLNGHEISAQKIVQNVKRQVARKKMPVILMHEREVTVNALPEILEFLKGEGYTLLPIGGNVTPVNFWKY